MAEIRDIIKDWREAFPDLSKYGSNTLFHRCGPFLIGIKFVKINGYVTSEYQIYLQIVALWRPFVPRKEGYILNFYEVRTEKGLVLEIRFWDHKKIFNAVEELTKEQFGKFLKKEILGIDLFKYSEDWALNSKTGYGRHDLYSWVDTFELQLGLALYYDNQELVKEILDKIELEMTYWPESPPHLLDQEKWKNYIKETFCDREKFMEAIRINLENPKNRRLQPGEIIGVDSVRLSDFGCDVIPNPERNSIWKKLKSLFS